MYKNPPHLILSGKFCSGKTTMAQYLVDHYGYHKYAFADKLKQITYDLFESYIDDKKPRKLLQVTGDTIRNICKDVYGDKEVWVKYLKNRIEKDIDTFGYERIVIDDCRYLNELYAFTTTPGWKSVRIEVARHVQSERYRNIYGERPTIESMNFVSELQLDLEQFNWVIDNNGSLTDFFIEIEKMLELMPARQERVDYNPWEKSIS
jgi:dephospho-CoA kinase